MRKKILTLALCALGVSASAQDIYTMGKFAGEDLNGTAKFVGMGGAMSALGAEISTMGTNPAGIGLFRHADVSTSLSVLMQAEGEKFDTHGKSRVSYDQIGLVYPIKTDMGSMRYFNVGFNYHKRNNFFALTEADQALSGASQTWAMTDAASYWGGIDNATPLTVAGYQTYLYNKLGTTDDKGYDQYSIYNATGNSYRKWTTGGVQQYDFNLSTNISDRYFFGLTIGVYNVDIDSYSQYSEDLAFTNGKSSGSYMLENSRTLVGNGVDVKFGTIIYPLEGSSFRFGISVSTPVWYSLTASNVSTINSNIYNQSKGVFENYDYTTTISDHDFNINTPWKFNVSAAGTLGNFLALGAEYEYSDYSSTKLTYDDIDNDWNWGSTTKDRELNRQASRYLKGVSTIRLGAEAKLDYGLSLRLGYNYVSSPMKSNALQNQFINSASIDYSTSTNYTNLSDINRFTAGLGYKATHFYADFAWQYQKQTGDFYAFSTQQGNDATENLAPCTKLKLDRSQLLFTLGYKF